MIGGSYPGALSAWVQQKDPGVFWAYHASSAVVETITHFWEYFVPIEEALPRNCSNDVKAVISYVDHVLTNGADDDIQTMKAMFGLDMLTHHDDFAQEITGPLDWQEAPDKVIEFCDYLEAGDTTLVSGHDGGVGLSVALPLYASWVKSTVGETCTQYNCDTYNNPDSFNTPDDLTHSRQWDWLLCHNPFSCMYPKALQSLISFRIVWLTFNQGGKLAQTRLTAPTSCQSSTRSTTGSDCAR